MKKLLLVLALITALPIGAFAASCEPNTDKWNIGAFCITSQDTLIPTTSAGQQVIYETTTTVAENALSHNETGKVITDYGVRYGTISAACSKHVLPRAAVGLEFTLIAGSKCTTTLDTVDANDTILYTISGTALDAGDSIKSTGQAGDSVTVTSTRANEWSIRQMKAVWTDNGTN